ncbi:MAG: hypothetical protein U1E05_08765 [Patescibacteria group bacterium]|nr:hypothetical protein [Patescibacteria group bacterium]
MRVLFECARPENVVLTTPNREYNATWPNPAAAALRHDGHRFEWTRKEYWSWATRVVKRYDYSLEFHPLGPEHAEFGPPTQKGVFQMMEVDRG